MRLQSRKHLHNLCLHLATGHSILQLHSHLQTPSKEAKFLSNQSLLFTKDHEDEFNDNGNKWGLTRTPSLMSSTSIWNLIPVLDCFFWFSDLHFPPLENNNPSSFSTSLMSKQIREFGKNWMLRKPETQSELYIYTSYFSEFSLCIFGSHCVLIRIQVLNFLSTDWLPILSEMMEGWLS